MNVARQMCFIKFEEKRKLKKLKKLINKKKQTKHQCVINDIDKLNEEEEKYVYVRVSEYVVHMYICIEQIRR